MNETTQMWVLGIVSAIAYIGIVLWFVARFRRRRAENAARDDSFVSQVIACIRNGSVESIEHIHDLYSSHFGARVDGLSDLNHLSHLLRRSIQKIASSNQVGDSNHALIDKLPSLRQFLSANEERVHKEELRLPFSDAPHPERQLLEDILEMTKNDKEVVRTKLGELGKPFAFGKTPLTASGLRAINLLSGRNGGSLALSSFPLSPLLWRSPH